MVDHKLKVRVGAHEFEAEGSQESVERQFQLWRDLILATPVTTPVRESPPPPPAPPEAAGVVTAAAIITEGARSEPNALVRLFRREGPVISLAVLPNGANREADAALLILLGQRIVCGEDEITGVRLLQGMKRSGITVPRADRMFGDYMGQLVIRSGMHRAVRYRLTNPGMAKTQEMGAALLATIP